MLTEIQTIILTCLLGPEDKGAFALSRKRYISREKRRRHMERYPGRYLGKNLSPDKLEKRRKSGRESKMRARKDPLVRAVQYLNTEDWVKNNPEKSRASQRNARAKQKKRDPACKLAGNLRSRMGALLNGRSKSASTLKLLGCSIPEWKAHLESLFKPGMAWENYGPVWHVDHIKPCDLFDLTVPEQQAACFNWENTQPLFAVENLKKGCKYAG